MHCNSRPARSRLIGGAILLIVGAIALASNLGFHIPRDLWKYWPAIPSALGIIQMLWPGSVRARLDGFWLIALGFYGFVSVFEWFGLHWGTSWPIMVLALGIRILLGGVFRDQPPPGQGDPR